LVAFLFGASVFSSTSALRFCGLTLLSAVDPAE
jgi:hypothetical protein